MQFEAGSATVKVDNAGVLAVDLSEQMKAGDTPSLQDTSTFYFQDDKIIKNVDES